MNKKNSINYGELDNNISNGEIHPTKKDIEIADGLIEHIKTAKPAYFPKDGTPLEDVPLERLCDYLSIEVFPFGTDFTECAELYTCKIKAASYEEILEVLKYISSMIRKFPIYELSQSMTVLSIRERADFENIFKRISREPDFKRLIMPKIRDIIVQYLQN